MNDKGDVDDDEAKINRQREDHLRFVEEFQHKKALRTRRSVVVIFAFIQIVLSLALLGVTWKAARGVFMWVIDFLYILSAFFAMFGARLLNKSLLLLHFVACICLCVVVVVFLSIEESLSSDVAPSYIEVFIPFVVVITSLSIPSMVLYGFIEEPAKKQEGICDCCFDPKYSFNHGQEKEETPEQTHKREADVKTDPSQQEPPKDRTLCILCFEKPRLVAFLPCGHISCCETCAATVKSQTGECPICRIRIQTSFKAYLA